MGDMKEIPDGTFDYAIDKGTMDSILCGSNSTCMAYKYLQEVKRVLKPGGTLLIVSYGGPQSGKFTSNERPLDSRSPHRMSTSQQLQGSHQAQAWSLCIMCTHARLKTRLRSNVG